MEVGWYKDNVIQSSEGVERSSKGQRLMYSLSLKFKVYDESTSDGPTRSLGLEVVHYTEQSNCTLHHNTFARHTIRSQQFEVGPSCGNVFQMIYI